MLANQTTLAWLLCVVAAAPAAAQGIAWQNDLEAAKAVAKQSGKLVLVHFWTTSCGPCRALESNVFSQPAVASTVNENFIAVKLNADEYPATAQALGVTRVPTDVVLSPDGSVVERMVSPATPMAYVAAMGGAVAKQATQSGANYQNAIAQAPYAAVANQAYAGIALPGQPAAPAPPAANPSAPAAGQVANPYASWAQAPPQAPVAPPAGQLAAPSPSAPADRYAAPGSAPAMQQVTPPPALAASSVNNPHAAFTLGQSTPPQAPAVAQAPAQVPAQAGPTPPSQAPAATTTVQLPPGAPPLGFDGYCPVTMKQEWRWTKGDVRWGAIHRGRTYLFANQQLRDEFLKSPDAFSPALSGVDPVIAIDENRAVPGARQFALEYQGQFYMFSNEETLNRFWTNAERYAAGVRQAMAGTPQRTVR